MPEPSCLFVLGQGVRALAQSARQAGRRVVGIDAFADLDTREACAWFVRAKDLSADALADAAMRVALPGSRPELIVGGGLDGRPDLLSRLQRVFRLRGNSPEVAQTLGDPRHLFALLDELGIAYPEVRFAQPPEPQGWLLKHAASCGGQGVGPAGAVIPRPRAADTYFQRQVSGQVVSVLFVANGSDARVLGCNRLLCAPSVRTPYGYGGAIGWAGPGAERQAVVNAWARCLTRALGLRGINGIDLILGDPEGTPLLLEVNARPTATLELHEDRQLGAGGVQCHLDACTGQLPPPTSLRAIRGVRPVYAEHGLTVSNRSWPLWCSDRPPAGTHIAAGQPLCSVHALGLDGRQVQRQLAERTDAILQSFDDAGSQAA
jgi:uncharacterized protein